METTMSAFSAVESLSSTTPTGVSPDSSRLASPLQYYREHSTLSTDSSNPTIPSTCSPLSKAIDTSGLQHKQKVLIPLKNLKEISPSITAAQFNVVDKEADSAPSSHLSGPHTTSPDHRKSSLTESDTSLVTTNSSTLTPHYPVPEIPPSTQSKLESRPEVIICPSLDKVKSPLLMETEVVAPCTHKDESNLQGLKLDGIVDKGYKVLKDVKRHKSKVETDWDLADLNSIEHRLSELPAMIPAKKKSQPSTKIHFQEQLDSGLHINSPSVPNSSQPLYYPDVVPNTQLLYQYMTTGQVPMFGVPIPAVMPSSTDQQSHAHSAPPSDKNMHAVSSKDIGVNTDESRNDRTGMRNHKEPQLVLEVLPSVNIQDCLDSNIPDDLMDATTNMIAPLKEERHADLTTETPCPTLSCADNVQPSDTQSVNIGGSVSNPVPPPTHPVSIPISPPTHPIGGTVSVVNHPISLPTHPLPSTCVSASLPDQRSSSDAVNERVQTHLCKKAQEWTHRELTTRALAQVQCGKIPYQREMPYQRVASPVDSSCSSSLISDSDVIDLVKQELVDQIKLHLRQRKHSNESATKSSGHYDGDNEEYSFTFESDNTDEVEDSINHVPTPQLTPPCSPPPVPLDTDIIPTPQLSPVLIESVCHHPESNSTPLQDGVSTPEMSSSCSEQRGLSPDIRPIATPTLSFSSKQKEEVPIARTVANTVPVSRNVTLSLSESVSTSSSTPLSTSLKTRPPLSMSNTTTDNDISYGENICHQPLAHDWKHGLSCDRNVSISEGEVPLSPGDVRWNTHFPVLQSDLKKPTVTLREMKPIHIGTQHLMKSFTETISNDYQSTTEETSYSTEIENLDLIGRNQWQQGLVNLKDGAFLPQDNTPTNTNKEVSLAIVVDDEDTLADVPSLSEGVTMSVSVRADRNHDHNNTRSPGEVVSSITTVACNNKSLSEGEVPPTLFRMEKKPHQQRQQLPGLKFGSITDDSESSLVHHSQAATAAAPLSSSVNELRNGIEVINISRSQASLQDSYRFTNGGISSMKSRSNIVVSSEAPSQDIPETDLSSSQSTSAHSLSHDVPIMQLNTAPAVVLMDDVINVSNKETTNYSFTLSSDHSAE